MEAQDAELVQRNAQLNKQQAALQQEVSRGGAGRGCCSQCKRGGYATPTAAWNRTRRTQVREVLGNSKSRGTWGVVGGPAVGMVYAWSRTQTCRMNATAAV